MIFDRSHIEGAVIRRVHACSYDELRVLDRVLDGIERGREVYGPLDLQKDGRDFRREGAMECRDYLFYACAHEVARDDYERDRRTDQFRRAIGDGLAELRGVEAIESEHARRAAPTEDLELCCCGHPASVHAARGCLIDRCGCLACQVV